MSGSQSSILFTPFDAGSAGAQFPYEVRVFSHTEDAEPLYKLRYDAYRDAGFIGSLASASYNDDADFALQAVHIGAFRDQDCKCAMRMTFKGWNEPLELLPCAPFFPALRSAGLRKLAIAEISHLIVSPKISDPGPRKVLYASMLRAGLLAVQAARVAMLVSAAAREWLEIYKQLLRFHPIGSPAHYPPATDAVTLMGSNMIGAGRREVDRSAFFKTSEQEVCSMREALLRALGTSPHTRVLAQSMDAPGA